MRADQAPDWLGPYRLLRRLGEGGMGVVYLATDDAGQLVAVKALRPGLAGDQVARRRLTREVEAMRRVRSRNVAEVLAADLDGDVPFIVTRYVSGQTLDAMVSESGPLATEGLARLVCGLSAALSAIHAAGVVHRDLKPANVMISDGEPVVIDFGIAQMPDTTRLTMTGMFMGTPGYLAPEVIEGTVSGPAADVHSWGATVAFAATGRPPYGTGAFESIFYRIMHGQPDLGAVPIPLRPVLGRALLRIPEARPSAAELGAMAARLDPATLVPPATGAPVGAVAHGVAGPGPLQAAAAAAGLAPAGLAGAGGLGPGLAAPGLGVPGLPGPGLPAAGTRSLADQGRAGLPGIAARRRGRRAAAAAAPPAPVPWPVTAPAADGSGPTMADLLPEQQPSRPAGAPPGELPGSGAAAQRPPGPAVRPRPGDRSPAPVSPWSPLVIAVVAVAVAAAVAFPVAGTLVMLAAFLALQAAGRTGRRLARRAAGGGRAASAARAAAFYPLALLRSMLRGVLMAPVGVLAFGLAAAATAVLLPVHPLPTAVAFGAGALVAVVGLGPGSHEARSALAGLFGRVAVRPERTAVVYVGMGVLAVASVITAASGPVSYWPVMNVHALVLHLPGVHSLLHNALVSLTGIARRTGL